MKLGKRLISIAAVCIFWSTQALGDNSIFVESKTFLTPDTTGITIGLYITNDVDLTALVLPLELREIDPGCYITNTLTFAVQGRVSESGLMDLADGPYYSPIPAIIGCSGPTSDAFDIDTLGTPDFISPDGIFWAGLNTTSSCLAAGSDGSPDSGTPSFLFTFDMSGTPGTFEIDTCCHGPGNHLLFVPCGTTTGITPAFIKGEIQIVECDCTDFCDVNLDGNINPVDVVHMVNYVYKNLDAREQIFSCPGDNGDWDCSGHLNPLDVVWFVNFVYKSVGNGPCDACTR